MNTSPETTKATPPEASGMQPNIPQQEPQTTRKRRGRPFAVPPLEETKVDAQPGEPPQDSTTQTRKRRAKTVDSAELAKQLRGIHALAAKLLPIRVNGALLLELSDVEATQLANAVAGVAKEYDLELDGKTGAAIQLIAVAAMIYGPRVYVIQQMRVAARAQPIHTDDPSVVASNLNGSATAASN